MKYLFLLLFLCSNVCIAQDALFNKSIELNPDIQDDIGSSVIINDEGDIIVIGKTRNRYDYLKDSLVITKLNAEGNVKWYKTYDLHDETWEFPNEVILLLDDAFLVGGTVQYQEDFNQNAFLLKLDSLGNIMWYQEYGDEAYQAIQDLISTQDGGFIFVKRTNQLGTVDGSYDAWVVKTDSLGNIEWEQTYGDSDWNEVVAITEIEEGRYKMIVTNSDNSNWATTTQYEINEYGEIINEYIIENQEGNKDYFLYQIEVENNNFLLSGSTQQDGLLVKIDSVGNVLWSLLLSEDGATFEYLRRSILLPDGNYMLCGTTLPDNYTFRGWLVKITPEGELLWKKPFQHDEDNIEEYFEDMALHPDGSVVIVGFTQQLPEEGQLNMWRNNMWIVKVDQEGNDWLPLTVEVAISDTFVCVSDTVFLSTMAYNGKYCAYSNGTSCPDESWWMGNGVPYLDDSQSFFIANENGIYDLTYSVVDQAGDTATASITSIIVFNQTELSGLEDITVYVGDSLDITPNLVDINTPYFAYEWSGNGTAYLSTLTDTTTFVAQDSGIYNLSFYYEFGADCSDITSFQITVLDTLNTNLSEIYLVSPFQIYPNPTQDYLIIEQPQPHQNKPLHCKIYNGTGQLVHEQKLNTSPTKIAVNTLKSGIYLCQLQDENGIHHSEKILIQR